MKLLNYVKLPSDETLGRPKFKKKCEHEGIAVNQKESELRKMKTPPVFIKITSLLCVYYPCLNR